MSMNRRERRAAETQTRGGSLTPAADQIFRQAAQLHQAGRIDDAETLYRRVLALVPRHGESLNLLAAARLQQGQAADAVTFAQRAIAADPRAAPYHNNLGSAQEALGRLADAAASFRQAIALRPEYLLALTNLARVLAGAARWGEAIDPLRRALALAPQDTALWGALAGLLMGEARIAEAADAYRAAIEIDPRLAANHNGLGNALAALGRPEEAVAAYDKAVRLAPGDLAARSNLIMTLHSLPDVSGADIFDEARRYAAQAGSRPAPAFDNTRDPDRPLRVGYVSADFRAHPVGYFLEPVLAAHAPGAVEPFLYGDVPLPDAQTDRLRALAAWRPIAGCDDAAVERMIRADRIDILVDLAGHTGSNRLPLFARRAAPVQASWLGYFGTSGLATIDHIIADAIVLPPEDDALFSERPLRIDAPYLCWTPPREAVAVGPTPALANGHVTFGCFNNIAKLNDDVVKAWAAVLRGVEGARLFLKSWSLGDPACRAGIAAMFADYGIGADRLVLEGFSPRAAGLSAYGGVDIALDPFPFGGCTTSLDTLWMGVPLVTLAGARWSGRMSRTILSAIGHPEWVAANAADYVDTAIRLAGDVAGLAAARGRLRAAVEESALCDGPGFTRRLEAAYRAMWRRWLDRR